MRVSGRCPLVDHKLPTKLPTGMIDPTMVYGTVFMPWYLKQDAKVSTFITGKA